MLDINVMPCTILTKLLMEKLLQRDKRSAIVFCSSLISLNFFPGYATYGASKSYMDFLAVALAHENKDKMDVMSF